jgi:hypothetical protein
MLFAGKIYHVRSYVSCKAWCNKNRGIKKVLYAVQRDNSSFFLLIGKKNVQPVAVGGEIYYPKAAVWEMDYILKDIFAQQGSWHVNFYSSFDDLMATIPDKSVLIDSADNIFVFNSLSYAQTRAVVKHMQPSVVFHLSDEQGTSPEYISLADEVPVMLRQYRHAKYGSMPENLHQMPLGYMTGMLQGTSSIDRIDIKNIQSRNYDWSFIGTVKQDRSEMIKKFSRSLSKNYVSHQDSAQRTFEIYKDSVFVPNGRGWVVLDCFRLYEASLAGAIPVVVGSELEIAETFKFDGELPPWIFERDWNTAVARCVELLSTPAILQTMQERNLAWWKDQMMNMRQTIAAALR